MTHLNLKKKTLLIETIESIWFVIHSEYFPQSEMSQYQINTQSRFSDLTSKHRYHQGRELNCEVPRPHWDVGLKIFFKNIQSKSPISMSSLHDGGICVTTYHCRLYQNTVPLPTGGHRSIQHLVSDQLSLRGSTAFGQYCNFEMFESTRHTPTGIQVL